MINVDSTIVKNIIAENASFDYIAGKGEIAHQYWSQHLTWHERNSIVQSVGHKSTALKTLTACLKVIEDAL